MPIKTRRVFNYQFSTDVLFRCLPKKYAQDFIKGKIRFSKPSNWIKIEEEGNKGQGDVLEGIFFSTSSDDKSEFIINLKKKKNVEFFEKNKLIYFRNQRNLNLYSLCLYGLNDNMFMNEYTDRFGKKHKYAIIGKDYFSTFNSINSEKEYFDMDEVERPSVIFITNPHAFFEKIRNFFINIGIPDKDIIIQPVEYVDYSIPFINILNNPLELFLKDKYFSYQSEIRIVINNDSSKINEYMEKEHWIIDIGDISDYAIIYDNYFHDLLLEKHGNVLYFTLPFPEEYKLEDLSLKQLLSIYIQTANNELPDEKTAEEIEVILNKLNDVINKKYKISVYMENGELIIHNPKNVDVESLFNN